MVKLWKPRGDFKNASGWDPQIPEKIRELAARRGLIEWDQFHQWTRPKLSNLRDPMTLKDMELAVNRLVQAHTAKERIALYGDFDLDGTSALAMLSRAFGQMGYKDLILYQPSRLTEGYGVHVAAVERLKSQEVRLIVTADVGVTAIKAAECCHELNIDLIITDHHLPAAEKPRALALINPNQEGCASELGHLSGVGVAFYLVWALRRRLIQLKLILDSALDLKELLDCFVIGTLTDLVPIQDENRILVKHGLIQLAQTKRPGIRLLLEELGLLGRELSSQDVAIRFAPKLNALSRMEKDLRPLDVFLVENEIEAKNLMSRVLQQNDLRVSLQNEAERKALDLAKNWSQKPFIFIFDSEFHKGIIGLVATRLSQVHHKPAFVGSLSPDGIVVGSARAPQNWNGNLVDVLKSAEVFLHRFGGHSNAAGFEYSVQNESEITSHIDAYFSSEVIVEKQEPICYDVDIDLTYLNPKFMQWLDCLGPFGTSFEVPLFKLSDLSPLTVKELRGGHRRVHFASNGLKCEALLFGPSEKQILTLSTCQRVDVLAEMQWNYYQSQKRLQMLIKEVQPSNLGL